MAGEMTAEDVRSKIDLIRASHRDYESAHGMEDKLLWEFVEYLSNPLQAVEPAGIKEIALLLFDWHKESADHPRHCA